MIDVVIGLIVEMMSRTACPLSSTAAFVARTRFMVQKLLAAALKGEIFVPLF